MLVVTVFITWLCCAILSMALGSFAVTRLAPKITWIDRARISLWLGAALSVLYLAVMNFFVPLGSGVVFVGLILLAGVSLVIAILIRRGLARLGVQWKFWMLVPTVLILSTLVLIAHAFAGPVDNWDAGLYQLNAIQYSAGYPVIPGLANFHERLGTNMSSSLVAAALSASPWGIDAFRLTVGFFAFLFLTDLFLRMISRRQLRSGTPGFTVMAVSAGIGFAFLIPNVAMWVTTPTPDTISMLLVLVAVAYLLDALWLRSGVWGSVAVVVAFLSATVRTQLWVFAFLVVLAVLISQLRAGKLRTLFRTLLPISAALTSAALFIVMLVRDYLFSGWLLFPASVLPLPVDWRVPDPEASRLWIMSWARQPGASPDDVLGNWDWLWPWVGRSAQDWAILGATGLLGVALLLVLLRRMSGRGKASRVRVGWRGMVLALLPVLAAVAVWFVAAPDPRFAWGPLLALGLIPAAIAWSGLSSVLPKVVPYGPALSLAVMVLLLSGVVLGGLLNVRGFIKEGFALNTYSFGPLTLTAAVNPITTPEVAEFALNDGNVILTPTADDKCFLTFPLCRPYPDATLQFRGPTVEDGFRSGR